ncbi:LANO_0E15324g1_1 [Lachancea nothofagi CBS 11611]|uniref:LANO_0E15324g1_1 n=1 Tax=Lachancea nothofagi CBS 11611 TaxID=1266666 RepID=A0A1G4K0W0_9SACH|nr:LANO_0E15324g1_1 [Lachancea nothofagi CBS 11611]
MNNAISKTLDVVTTDAIVWRQLARRLLAVYGVSGVMALLKWKVFIESSSQKRVRLLLRGFQNASWVCGLISVFPLARRIFRNKRISFNAALLTTTQLEIPPWLSTYVLVESLADWTKSLSFVQHFLLQLSEPTSNTIRQVLLSLVIPWLRYGRSSRIQSIMFERKPLWRDFASLFLLWNSISLYQFFKSSLYRKQRQQKRQSIDEERVRDSYTLNSRLFKDKLKEINEITTSRSLREKVISCCFGENLQVSIKWAAWRQLLWSLLGTNQKVCSNLQMSAMLMLGFYVLDSENNQMFVRPGVLRYMVRFLITDKMRAKPHWQTIAFWIGSNLSYQNQSRQRQIINLPEQS